MSETIVYSAKKIITMNPSRPEATHVAVRDGRILGAGSLSELQTWGDVRLDERFKDKVLMFEVFNEEKKASHCSTNLSGSLVGFE